MLLLFFVVILAALGAAFVMKGRELRGLFILLVANATVATGTAALSRWAWTAFSLAMTGLCLLGIAIAKGER